LSLAATGSALFYTALLALALAVCGLYGQDLHHASQQHKYMDSKWVFAVVVGGLAAVTAILYMIPGIATTSSFVSLASWAWHLVIGFLWLSLFGLFGHLYVDEPSRGDAGIQRMKNAVWVDLANSVLWLLAALGHFIYWIRARDPGHRTTSIDPDVVWMQYI